MSAATVMKDENWGGREWSLGGIFGFEGLRDEKGFYGPSRALDTRTTEDYTGAWLERSASLVRWLQRQIHAA